MVSRGVLPRHKLRGLSVLNVALVAVVVAIAVSAYLLFFKSDSQAAGTTRPSVAVSRGDVTASVSSSGTLQSPQTASPQFETSGTVTSVLVKVGQVVAKGAPIAKIDPSAAQRAVRIAEQNQTAAADSVTAAQQTLDDAQEAVDAAEATPTPTPSNGQQNQSQGQSPEVALTNAKASLARAKADKEQADQNLEGAQADLAATTLKAPIAGTVTAINGTVGSVTGGSGTSSGNSGNSGNAGSSGTAGASGTGQGGTSTSSSATASSGGFIDISDLKSLQVVAAFPEADAIKIKAGQSATVTLNAEPGTNLTASLTSVSPTPTTTNGVVSYSATFTLSKLPVGARIGQTANVSVQTAKASNVLYVPTTAIVTSGTTHTVTMADGSGTREVQLGVRGDSFTQITSGLNEGDQVELIQGAIGGTTGGTGQGRNGQFPGGQFPVGGTGTGGGFNRGR
ncbi:efflux RND transporter periplasmic adaptor subunit [Kribbella monticola]|uniref:efflux RND transporter periplasmic adaptor subunit n=1 Tax=Kribbella monticola TaxID=2185285 RepID=UPI000DD2F4ED|nr:HlyD family efflux transporter periplasmic adaptor subunit [Kribbella monticola]